MLAPETATALVHAYGADKVLFATDFPMWPIKDELERFAALDLTGEEREKIFYKNACKLFDIRL
jgi:predicted TIM-barrel fold metal-dependent hydrolase